MIALFLRFLRLAVLLPLTGWGVLALAAPSDADQVITPKAAPQTTVTPADGPGAGALTVVAVVLLAGAGGWMLWRSKSGALAGLNRAQKKLIVEETRSLGNRQYLVVAAYENKKFLLGICPGKIELIAPLTAPDSGEEKPRS